MKRLKQNYNSIELSNTSLFRKSDVKAVSDGKYIAKIVENAEEFEAVLQLRSDVFKKELSNDVNLITEVDFDKYDLQCDHIVVTEKITGKAVGTYRLNTIERAKSASGFYAHNEFSIEDLPNEILNRSVELGRACIAKDHRNSRVLFLLWKVLANFLVQNDKQYFFGCCSIFTQDGETAAKILQQLKNKGHLHKTIEVKPRENKICIPKDFVPEIFEEIELPSLVNIYLRVGVKVCGEPAIDREFKTIDYFVLFDLNEINERYRKMFFS